MNNSNPQLELAKRDKSAFLIIDFQEKFLPVISVADQLERILVKFAKSARILRVPLLVTEQYPKGLGATAPDLQEFLDPNMVIEKVAFGCFGEQKFCGKLDGLGIDTLFIAGVETHVCVAQTALQALARGLQVHVLADAVGSRFPYDSEIALRRMESAGVVITTWETAVFELMEKAGGPEFKEMRALVTG